MPEIEHGTPKGYRQHKYRGTDICQGCREAHNAEVREKKAERRKTQAQADWYGGKYGPGGVSRTPTPITPPGQCTTDGCGQATGLAQSRPDGWVQIQVVGSREPARLYCSGSCANYGIALAELRVGGELHA